jgi:hypothetical protein
MRETLIDLLPAKKVQVGEIPAQIRVDAQYYRHSLGLSPQEEEELVCSLAGELAGQSMSVRWFRDTPRVRELLRLPAAA